MTILYCKNTPVYNIDTEEVYNKSLLPGYMIVHGPNRYTFKTWFKLRYSSNTNTLARQLKGVAFGQGNRVSINRETHALSLSDCYWVKEDNDKILFEQVSPYYHQYWKGIGEYIPGVSVPTLYVGGCLRKEWTNSRTLVKYGSETFIEKQCMQLCNLCSIPVNKILIINNGIAIENFTNPNFMLEQADESGRIDTDDFDEYTIEKIFGVDGVKMILVDAIIGNGDRHTGNFGWLRDTNNGQYVRMAPLYDFDHALDSKLKSDRLITDTIQVIKLRQEYIIEAIKICKTAISSNINSIFSLRANTILDKITVR